MATGLEYCSLVSVETRPSDICWVIVVEMSLSGPTSLDKPFVTFTAGQDPPLSIPLKPFNDGHWRGIWVNEINPTLSLPKYIVTFFDGFEGNLNRKDEVGTWELHPPPTVSH